MCVVRLSSFTLSFVIGVLGWGHHFFSASHTVSIQRKHMRKGLHAPEPITPSRHPAVSRHSGTSLSGLTTWVALGALSGTMARKKYPANEVADGRSVPEANVYPTPPGSRAWALAANTPCTDLGLLLLPVTFLYQIPNGHRGFAKQASTRVCEKQKQ